MTPTRLLLALALICAYSTGYWFGHENWHPKPATEIFHQGPLPKEIFHITSEGRLIGHDPQFTAALEKETTHAACEALECWMLLDLELHYKGENLRNGERALIVAQRMKFEPDPSWRAAKGTK